MPIGLLAISEEIALLTTPRPTQTHPHQEALSQALDCTAMLMFYAKVIRQRNAVLEHIGHQFLVLGIALGRITLRRESWTPAESFAFGEAELKPLRSGESLPWRMVSL